PSAATKVRTEHGPPKKAAQRGSQAARDDVLLVTVNDRRLADLVDQRRCDRIRSLSADVPRTADHTNVEGADALLTRVRAEGEETGRKGAGHVPRQFQHVPLRSADHAVTGVEESRNYMEYGALG